MFSHQNLRGVIVGLGSIGNRHLQNLLQLGVNDLTVVRRENSQNNQFEVPESVTTSHCLQDALARQPDFVVVCNPSHMHVATARQCLEAGCHVLIEKPLSGNCGDEEQSLQTLAKQTDKVAALAYCMRYHPAYCTAREQVKTGAIGRVLYAKAWFEGYLPDWHPWEDYRTSYAARTEQAGGVMRTLDHELDFISWVLGPADKAQGWVTNTGGIGIEADDLAMYQLRHAGGVCSQITTSFCRKPASRGFEFVGERGTLKFRMEDGKLCRTMQTSPTDSEVLEDLSSYDINEMYIELAQDFLAAVSSKHHRSESLATIADGLNCSKIFPQIDTDTEA